MEAGAWLRLGLPRRPRRLLLVDGHRVLVLVEIDAGKGGSDAPLGADEEDPDAAGDEVETMHAEREQHEAGLQALRDAHHLAQLAAQDHDGNDLSADRFEQISGLARAVADIVTDEISDDGGVARVIFRDALLYLPDEIGAHIRCFRINPATELSEHSDEAGAKPEADYAHGDLLYRFRLVLRRGADGTRDKQPERDVLERHSKNGEGDVDYGSEGAPSEAELERLVVAAAGGRCDTYVGAHRHPHPRIPAERGADRPEQEGRGRDDRSARVAEDSALAAAHEQVQSEEEDSEHDGQSEDRAVLGAEEALAAFFDRLGHVLHGLRAAIVFEDPREQPRAKEQREGGHHERGQGDHHGQVREQEFEGEDEHDRRHQEAQVHEQQLQRGPVLEEEGWQLVFPTILEVESHNILFYSMSSTQHHPSPPPKRRQKPAVSVEQRLHDLAELYDNVKELRDFTARAKKRVSRPDHPQLEKKFHWQVLSPLEECTGWDERRLDFYYVAEGALRLTFAGYVGGEEQEVYELEKGQSLQAHKYEKIAAKRQLVGVRAGGAHHARTRVVRLAHAQYYEAQAWLSASKYNFSSFVLSNVPLLKTFTSGVQNKVIGAFVEREFKQNEFALKAGERASHIFLIISGECALYTTHDLRSRFMPLKLLSQQDQTAIELKAEENKAPSGGPGGGGGTGFRLPAPSISAAGSHDPHNTTKYSISSGGGAARYNFSKFKRAKDLRSVASEFGGAGGDLFSSPSPHIEKRKLQNELMRGEQRHRELGWCVGKFLGRTWIGEDVLLTGQVSNFSALATSKVLRVLQINCETALKEIPSESLHALSLSYERKRSFMRGQLFRMKKFEAEQHPDSEISVNSHVEKYYPQASRSARKLLKNIMVAESGYNARVVVARSQRRESPSSLSPSGFEAADSYANSVLYEGQAASTILIQNQSVPSLDNMSVAQSQLTFAPRGTSFTKLPSINTKSTRNQRSVAHMRKSSDGAISLISRTPSPLQHGYSQEVLQEYGQKSPRDDALSRLLKRKACSKSKSVKMLTRRKDTKLPTFLGENYTFIGQQPGSLIREGLLPFFRMKRRALGL